MTRTNKLIARRLLDNTWQRIGYEARQAASHKPIVAKNKISFKRQEPTWGDVDKILEMIKALGPANKGPLLSAFGLSLRGPKHLQIVRNACAHKNDETMTAVRDISIYYLSNPLRQPCELAWQLDKPGKTPAIYSWISDLKIIADLATRL